MIKKSFLLTFLVLMLSIFATAAPFKNIQRIVTQPNGEKLYCFASGDEFYNRLHDADGFTIIQDEKTGYYVYATADSKGSLTATSLIAGKSNPAKAGLKPNLMISQDEYLQRRNDMEKYNRPVESSRDFEINHGVYNNLVVYIRFAGDDQLGTTASEIDSMFNGNHPDDVSMNNYFHNASYNQLKLNCIGYPQPEGELLQSYEDIHPREYFMPYNAVTNPSGYQDWEHATREFDLLERAIEYVSDMVPETDIFDYNDDGYIDNVIFVVKGNVTDWATLLWPHRWSIYDRTVHLKDKIVYDFNFQLETSDYFNVSTLCHEMSHSLGSPDLYHYSYEGLTPVGGWDLMCSNSEPPQHEGIYMKYKYGNWVEEIPEITEYGTYTLEADSWEGNRRNAYMIRTSDPNQFYLIEYRDHSRLFETGLPGTGILIYRIDTRFTGCASYNGIDEFDEVYIFRPGGSQTEDGSIGVANFSKNLSQTEFNNSTDPYPFFTGGLPDNTFNIYNISESGDRMSFTYCPANIGIIPQNLSVNVLANNSTVNLKWNSVNEASSYKVYRDGAVVAENVSSNSYNDDYSNVTDGYHTYYVTAICGDEESYRSDIQEVITGDYCKIVFAMSDSDDNGWQGGEVKASFNNGMKDRYFTIYGGSERTESVIVPTGTEVTLNWLSGWSDSQCALTVSYEGGEDIFTSDQLSAGELVTFTNSCNSNPCIKPSNLTAAIDGTKVILNWASNLETEQFEIFRDSVSLAVVNANTYTDESISHSGTHTYMVRAKSADCESDFSNEAYATIMNYYCDVPRELAAQSKIDHIELSWTAPQTVGGLLCYDDGNYLTSIGAANMIWGIKMTPEQLNLFSGSQLSEIEIFDAAAGTYTFKIYNSEQTNNNTLIHTETHEMTGANDWVKFSLSEPVDFDAALPLWITVQSSGINNPGPCCKYVGDPNSCLLKSGTSWKPITMFGMNYSWMLRVYTNMPSGANPDLTYNIYRNGTLLASNYESVSYTDVPENNEIYCYQVSANFHGFETGLSEEACENISVGIDENKAQNVNIYPNPVKGQLTISCSNMQKIKVLNITGVVIYETAVTDENAVIDFSEMSSGVYMIQILTDNEVVTRNVTVVGK